MADEITDCYIAPDPIKVAKLLDAEDMDSCLDMWGYSQTRDSLYKLAAQGRILLGKAPPERDDADEIIAAGIRLGSAYYAAQHLGVSEIAVRTAFKRRSLPIPKLSPEARRQALLTKAAARKIAAAAARGYPISIRGRQLVWDF